MAATLVKFSLSSARVLLASTAVFIMLSVASVDGHQCFWCGPLAEQVHRSRRAPPCAGGVRHVTACEPGYSYCAVVATSPPYVESRYCVKIYQDECYPLYCNSTKTWKMTCPCRGDLCNGGNSERETEAFAVLPRLVAKTHARIQKRDASPPTLFKHKNSKIVNPNNVEVPDNSLDQGDVTTSNESVHTASDIDGTVNYASVNEDRGTEIHKNTTHAVNDSANISHKPITAMDNVSLPDDIQTSTNMIEIDLKKWYDTAGKDNGEVDAGVITLLSEHPKNKQGLDKINHEITKHDDSANIHDANRKKERPTIHLNPDTKETKSNLSQTELTTEAISNHNTPESASPASFGQNISSNIANNIQPSVSSPIQAFQQDESPKEKVAEEPENTINPTKQPTELSTIKDTSTPPLKTTGTSNNATVPVQSAQFPKNINKNYAATISANLIFIVHCVFFNSFV